MVRKKKEHGHKPKSTGRKKQEIIVEDQNELKQELGTKKEAALRKDGPPSPLKKLFGATSQSKEGMATGGASKIAAALTGATTFKAVHRVNVKLKEVEAKLEKVEQTTTALSNYHKDNFALFSLADMSKVISSIKEDLKQKTDSLEFKQTAFKVYTQGEEHYKLRGKLDALK